MPRAAYQQRFNWAGCGRTVVAGERLPDGSFLALRSAIPVLVLGGRHDRTCAVGASQDLARRLPNAELVVFEDSAHMMFAEEPERFLATVRWFLDRITG